MILHYALIPDVVGLIPINSQILTELTSVKSNGNDSSISEAKDDHRHRTLLATHLSSLIKQAKGRDMGHLSLLIPAHLQQKHLLAQALIQTPVSPMEHGDGRTVVLVWDFD